MTISEEKNKLTVRSEYFNLADTLECGQVFRYAKNDGSYYIISKDKHCRAEQDGGGVTITSSDIGYFKNYFALDEDYAEKHAEIISIAPELKAAAEAGKGIRLLRQDPFEMVISFIISANNNIPRIKGIIDRIAAEAGTKKEWGYAFPTQAQMCMLTEADFRRLGAGYRASYLTSASRAVTDGFLSGLTVSDTGSAMKKLLTVKGVGKKVADCIMLFGLGRGDTFPVDTWMEQALLTETLNTNAKIRCHYIDRLGSLAGLAQQYIYHYKRNIEKKTV